MVFLLFLIPVFACWGSFLNVLAYRLIHEKHFLGGRSFCPACRHTLSWYDMIPIISYLLLKGSCRACKKPISWLYPVIELLTMISMTALYLSIAPYYFFAYFILFSALLVTIRTDLESMLISRYVTLALVPFGFIFAFNGDLPLSINFSVIGALAGYGFLWLVQILFGTITGKQGIGQGDLDLMALVGSFCGPIGAWATLLLGSISGTLVAVGYMIASQKLDRNKRIPFGPFLAIGAIIYVLMPNTLYELFLR